MPGTVLDLRDTVVSLQDEVLTLKKLTFYWGQQFREDLLKQTEYIKVSL